MNLGTVAPATSRSWRWRLGRRTTRRALVCTWLLCCAAFVAFGLLGIMGIVWFLLFGVTFVANLLLYRATHRVANLPTRWIDERQQAVRNRAYRTAYLVLVLAISLPIAAGVVLAGSGFDVIGMWLLHLTRNAATFVGLGLAWLQAAIMLPTAILAWTEQDEVEDFA